MRKRLFTAVLALVLICSLLAGCGEEKNDEKPASPDSAETTAASIPPSAPITEPASAPLTEPETDVEETEAETEAGAVVVAPDEFVSYTESVGSSPQELYDIGCSQAVVVDSSGSNAQISFYYSNENGEWKKKDSLTCDGYVGRNGVVSYDDMHEGGMATPYGLWHIGEAFYIYDKPSTGLDSFRITEDTYWVDDPNSAYYNRKVVGTENKDWDSAEDMYYITPQYNYGFVFDYNADCIPGKGSAFFFHVAFNPTAGCVGTSEENVLAYLAELSAEKNPYMIII